MATTRWARRLRLLILLGGLALGGAADAELVGYWPLDGDAAAAVGTDGVLVNGPTSTTDRNGVAGGGLAFASTGPSSGSYVAIPGGGGLDGTTNATVSMWVQWNGTQDNGWGNRNGAVMGRQKNGQWSDDVMCIYNTTDPNVSIINWEANVNLGINSGVQPGSGTWHHVAATMTPGGQVLYVDGVARSTRSTFTGHRSDPSIPLTLGAWIGDGASYSTSTMDDVAVWDTAITPGQVAALAAQIVTPQTVATQLVRPVSARASSELASGGHNRRAANTVDGVGHTTTTANGWPSDAAGMWLSAAGDTTPTITFDLGGIHALDAAVVHNYNEATNGLMTRGVQQAAISISTDNVTYTPLGNITLDMATGNAVNPAQLLALGGLQARYIRADVLSNYGDASYTGLNEVEFLGTPLEQLPIRVASVTASSEIPGSNFDRRAIHLVDSTGYYADTHSVVPDGHMWLSASNDSAPSLLFDLGDRYSIDLVKIWNYNEMLAGSTRRDLLNRGVTQLEILTSMNGVDFDSLGVFSLGLGPGLADVDFSNQFDLNVWNVQYVRFDILGNYSGAQFPGAGSYTGLSEVQFLGKLVPEPATLALLAGGLLAMVRRRRRS